MSSRRCRSRRMCSRSVPASARCGRIRITNSAVIIRFKRMIQLLPSLKHGSGGDYCSVPAFRGDDMKSLRSIRAERALVGSSVGWAKARNRATAPRYRSPRYARRAHAFLGELALFVRLTRGTAPRTSAYEAGVVRGAFAHPVPRYEVRWPVCIVGSANRLMLSGSHLRLSISSEYVLAAIAQRIDQ